MLDEVRDRGAALVITGIAGIGKTTLLEVAREIGHRAGDMLVLATAGVPSEANLPFAALHRLLLPVLARAEDSAAQREAVRAAFGMGEGTAPGAFHDRAGGPRARQ